MKEKLINPFEKANARLNHNKESEEKLLLQDSALKAAANAIVIADINGMIEWVNPAFTKLTGYSSKDAIGKSTSLLKSNKQDPAFYKILWQTVLAGNVWNGKLINKKKNGKLYIEDQTITPVKDESGKILHFIAIKEDITEKQKLETESNKTKYVLVLKNAELEESQKALMKALKDLEKAKAEIELEKAKDEAMLESIGIGVFAVDRDKRFILINKKAEEIIGMRGDYLIKNKKTSADIQLEDNHGNPISPEKRPTYLALKTRQVISDSSLVIVRKDGSKIPISLTVTPIISQNGEIIGAIDVFRDISVELEIDKAKTDFVSIASHQLRTPLGITKWYIEAIYNKEYLKKAPPILKEYIDVVYNNNERLLDLVKDLLLVSRIDQGRIANDPKPVNIVQLIESIIEGLKILTAKNKVKIIFKEETKIPPVRVDSLKLREVIENLTVNGIKYNVPNGKLYITIDRKDNLIEISFKDTGIGISNSDKKSLFTKFFRSNQAFLTNPEGSGLGLYVVKSYIESWGGNIKVESIPKKGSTFFITLPIKPKQIKEGKEVIQK